MKKIFALLALVVPMLAFASGGEVALDSAPERNTDLAGLQRGAKLFVNYCLNCHSASMVRYNRMKDIGLTEQQIKDNLLFAGAKVGDTMNVAMNAADAKAWFGARPPDLSLVARARGTDWLYTYMRSFYRDESRPTGWNNTVFPNVGMPHVLWELQGVYEKPAAEAEEKGHAEGHEAALHAPVVLKQVSPGKLSPAEYDAAVADLVGFLEWMGEPQQNYRKQLGVWVLIFLAFFWVVAWRFNAAYWKDVK
ncbi:MAG: cytochrome c1 [Burkholderiaceae bacterium]|nr:MAG: cytochrome c1 [Burkholderiaceae bacterium]